MNQPLLSIIVVAYDMPRQALNTLRSLATDYQTGVRAQDYEVIVVENRSQRNMDAAAIAELPGNFRYFLREEPGVSPAAAINFGFAQAQGRFIGLMIDGARLVSPGVVEHALMAFRISADAMVVVPGYHLGTDEQQFHLSRGYTEEREQELLQQVDWLNNGYRLFEIACWSGANPRGFFHPFLESNCLFLSAEIFRDIGQADLRFDLPGGGALNLYLYRKTAVHPRTRCFMLAGEGSFHQLHGGVTTSEVEGREEFLQQVNAQLGQLLGHPFRSPEVEPVILGRMRGPMLPYLVTSAQHGMTRYGRFGGQIARIYSDDAAKAAAAAEPAP